MQLTESYWPADYSQPVIATINGQRLLISGGADGSVYAFKVRTGEPVWRLVISSRYSAGTPSSSSDQRIISPRAAG